MLIHKTTWKTYLQFVHLCSVPTLPFHAGKCWVTNDKSAFIGYNCAFRYCRLRFHAMPLLRRMSLARRLLFLRFNVLSLSRILTKPEFRGRGIATELIKQTLPLTKTPIIECVTRTEQICKMLATCGFRCFGWDPEKGYYYYIYSPHLNLEKFIADFFVRSEKPRRKSQKNQYSFGWE